MINFANNIFLRSNPRQSLPPAVELLISNQDPVNTIPLQRDLANLATTASQKPGVEHQISVAPRQVHCRVVEISSFHVLVEYFHRVENVEKDHHHHHQQGVKDVEVKLAAE